MSQEAGDKARQEAPPLLLDVMLGRLARWLRLMGYDVTYMADTDDIEIVRAARAQKRLVLTRDRGLAARRAIEAVLITSQDLDDQIEQVTTEVGPPPQPAVPRCVVCNTPLEPLSPQAARERVPPYVWRTKSSFARCPACKRIYWPGTHWEAIRERLGESGDYNNNRERPE